MAFSWCYFTKSKVLSSSPMTCVQVTAQVPTGMFRPAVSSRSSAFSGNTMSVKSMRCAGRKSALAAQAKVCYKGKEEMQPSSLFLFSPFLLRAERTQQCLCQQHAQNQCITQDACYSL